MEDLAERDFLHLQVRRIRRGRVSAAIAGKIREGHRVKIEGRFGLSVLAPASFEPAGAVASGTGLCADLVPIAVAAIREHPAPSCCQVVGARTVESVT